MKRNWSILIVMFIVAVMMLGCSGMQTKDVDIATVSGNYQVGESVPPVKVLSIDKENQTVTFQVPVFKHQASEEGLTDPDFKVSASVKVLMDKEAEKPWKLVSEKDLKDYQLQTEKRDGVLIATLKVNGKSPYGYYSPRIWGQDEKSGNWLWINVNDKFHRAAENGKPGYEFVFNINGKPEDVTTVPEKHTLRP